MGSPSRFLSAVSRSSPRSPSRFLSRIKQQDVSPPTFSHLQAAGASPPCRFSPCSDTPKSGGLAQSRRAAGAAVAGFHLREFNPRELTPLSSSAHSHTPTPTSSGLTFSHNLLQGSPPTIMIEYAGGSDRCNALVHSPCRREEYSINRRRLYHQDSPIPFPSPLLSAGGTGGTPHNHNHFQYHNHALTAVCSSSSPPQSSLIQRQIGVHNSDSVQMGQKRSFPSTAGPSSSSRKATPRSSAPAVKVGEGGFGHVFIGKYNHQQVAIKELTSNESSEWTLCAELNIYRLCHPNIIQILTFFVSQHKMQIVYEYFGQGTLETFLFQSGDPNVANMKFRLSIARQISSALEHCHEENILHCDIKPSNVLLDVSKCHCKLADFGCSRVVAPESDAVDIAAILSSSSSDSNAAGGGHNNQSNNRQHLGTPSYMSPEIIRGLLPSFKSDVYSFGIMLWEIVNVKKAYEGMHAHTIMFLVVAKNLRPTSINEDDPFNSPVLKEATPMSLITLMESCWVPDPTERPSFVQIFNTLNVLYA